MDHDQLYNKYRSRLKKEGVLKSTIAALIIAFAVSGLTALIAWIVGFNAGWWIAIGVLAVVACAVAPSLYYSKFRPTELAVARRLDGLGLDERAVTMLELKDDTSEIAALQRENAVASVATAAKNSTGKPLIAYSVPRAFVIAASVVGAFFLGMTVVGGLGAAGVIPNGLTVFGDVFSGHPSVYSVNYSNGGEGTSRLTSGDSEQSVTAGGSSSKVVYTADDYSFFSKWVDSYGVSYFDGPSRRELNVNGDIALKAYFDFVNIVGDDVDLSRYLSGEPGNSGTGGGSGGPGNTDLELNANDLIIDGKTKYTQDFEYYYQQAMEYIANSDLSPEERAVLESYYNTLK